MCEKEAGQRGLAAAAGSEEAAQIVGIGGSASSLSDCNAAHIQGQMSQVSVFAFVL
jgi:hypothetical protein